ncbi:MAG: Transposase like protein [Mucilaginibacter sp.]|nr:Transposase like protein [Mucilaginibacter sp.]
MPNTYTQLYIHFVFAVKYRKAIIQEEWKGRLQKYITGLVQNNGHKLLAINTMPDHLHLFIGLNPKQSISELMRLVKGDSSEFINKEGFTKRKFYWQEGYGAFSNSRSQIDGVVKYILNQKEHHAVKTFREEYIDILKDYAVEYDERYIFQDLLDAEG